MILIALLQSQNELKCNTKCTETCVLSVLFVFVLKHVLLARSYIYTNNELFDLHGVVLILRGNFV